MNDGFLLKMFIFVCQRKVMANTKLRKDTSDQGLVYKNSYCIQKNSKIQMVKLAKYTPKSQFMSKKGNTTVYQPYRYLITS